LAQAVKINRHYLARLLRLTLLAPDIIEAILDGREPDGMSIEKLRRPIPLLWEEQRELTGCVAGKSQASVGMQHQ